MYQLTVLECLEKLKTNEDGLNEEEVKKRIEEHGKNIFIDKKNDNFIIIFLKQFDDLLVIILIISAITAGCLNDIESMIVILSVVFLNAILGMWQTMKANQSIDSLKKITPKNAYVKRSGIKKEIKSEDIVVGDIVFLESGLLVPADGRIILSNGLKIQESSITGEAESRIKTVEKISKEKGLAERNNMAYSGTLVTNGKGIMVTSSTGMNTEIGHIADLMNKTKAKKTPLQLKLNHFSKVFAFIVVFISLSIFLICLYKGSDTFDSLMFSVALAVAAIPEALGSIVTITLSIATEKMAKRNIIIKEPKALEALGSVNVLCSDKTGTITENKMKVNKAYIEGSLYNNKGIVNKDFLDCSYICNNAFLQDNEYVGDPTDIAFLDLAKSKNHHVFFERIEESPFDSKKKMMSVKVRINNEVRIYSKGALEPILEMCSYYGNDKTPLTGNIFFKIKNEAMKMANDGLRVLSLSRTASDGKMIFIGIAGLIDPPKKDIYKAITNAQKANIRVVMITGDQLETAVSIAKRIGINDVKGIDAKEFSKLSSDEFEKSVFSYNVFTRVNPEDKLRIVDAFQRKNLVVAMIGDGVNDAPALKKADIGISMGLQGTSVSQDASQIVIVDDNFNTIVDSIVTGRSVYLNITNSIAFLISGNIAGILSVIYATLFNLNMPFLPEHLLFINLLTDSIPAIAIGMMKENENLIRQKPRKKDANIININLWRRVLLEGILIFIFTMISYHYGLKKSYAMGSTLAFSTLCLSRLYHGFNSTSKGSIMRFGIENKYSVYSFFIGLIMLNLVLFIPILMDAFKVSEIGFEEIIVLNLMSLAPTIIIQVYKYVKEGIKGYS